MLANGLLVSDSIYLASLVGDALMDESSIYEFATQMLSEDERADYLNQICGEDGELRARIEQRLAENEQLTAPQQALDEDVTNEFTPTSGRGPRHVVNEDARIGSEIGPYRLVSRVGEGGMGTVWLADQREPVKRTVALKIIKAGMDTSEVIARFEAERQALARMNHPNIAKVLDAGSTKQGRPYFVMEYVSGIPVTKYCDTHNMSTDERLDLFCDICHAIQHAHHKGIIHRDIKPSNVLVAEVDNEPVVKVIDFGLAKATNARLTDKTLFTQLGQMVGTPAYMSPEQADAEPDIDMRTDVYSLGVLLYELLTGVTPIDISSLRKTAFKEVQRLIREYEPPRMSQRLSSLGHATTTTASHRSSDPRRLVQQIRGDLDVIAMKALDKDRGRRYETPGSFAADVRRYLNREVIEARPASALYRMQKFWFRNRIAVSTAALVLVAMVLGTVISVWQAMRANRAALAERNANQQAQMRLVQVEKGAEMLGSIFKEIDLRRIEGDGKTLEQVLGDRLKEASSKLVADEIGDQEITAKLQTLLGESLYNFGHFQESINLYEQAVASYKSALGPNDPLTLTSQHNLAECFVLGGEYDRAIELHKDTLARSKKVLGESHVDTLASMKDLGNALVYAARPDEGVPYLEEALRQARLSLPDEDNFKLTAINSLAFGYQNANKPERALPLLEETVQLRRKFYGTDHYDTMTGLNNLASCYYNLGQVDKALPLMKEVYELRNAKLGPAHPHTVISMTNLAVVLEGDGQRAEALPYFEKSLAISESENGPNHPGTLLRMRNLANCVRDMGDTDRALELYRACVDREGQRAGTDSLNYAGTLIHLGFNLVQLEKWQEAELILKTCLDLRIKHLADDDWRVASTQSLLGAVLEKLGRLDEAEPHLIAGYTGQKAKQADIPSGGQIGIQQALDRLIAFYQARDAEGDAEQVERWRAEIPAAD